jgi:hypothetical protein
LGNGAGQASKSLPHCHDKAHNCILLQDVCFFGEELRHAFGFPYPY